ncbi:hypothetical protein ACFE04_005847 [Oxalis oulophora]
MAPLKSLERENPLIDSNFQSFCASHRIFTLEDFLLHDIYELTAFAERDHASEKLKQGITQVLSIIDTQHQPWLNAMELLQDARCNKHTLATGIERFDLFLQGGLREGQLIELVGPSSSGKTQICLHAASNVANMHIGSTIYLDTGNSFSSLRISRLVEKSRGLASNQARHSVLQKVMSNIICHSVFDIFMMVDVLNQLEFNLGSQINRENQRVRLLVIDSISSLLAPILGGSGSQGHALMVSAGYMLKKLAHDYNLAVLVTNHTVGGDGGISKPALGESWKNIPHARLILNRDRESNSCNISVIKHPSLASGTSTTLKMFD